MIDLALARKEPEKIRAALHGRGGRYAAAFDELLACDAEYRRRLAVAEEWRAKLNSVSKRIGEAMAAKNQTTADEHKKEAGELKGKLAEAEKWLKEMGEADVRKCALGIPNLPHESAPLGKSEADNPVTRTGKPPLKFDFKPLDHQTLGENLGILDFAAGAKLSGSRFALWRGAGARLMRAIAAFELEMHGKAGYQEIIPPYLVRPEILEATGQLPKFEADLYSTKNREGENSSDLYLIPTAEVPLTNLVREEILSADRLPMKMTAATPCFRQEAGSYGKDVRGLIRNHQFEKVELVWICKPEDSLAALEQLTKDAEAVLIALGIPHRVIELCTADLGFASRKTYDIEVWMPSENRYREISSCSDCGDFQARRMNARFRRQEKAPAEFVHTLNGSGVAVGRLFAAILENFQREDGGIEIPPALEPFFGKDRIQNA